MLKELWEAAEAVTDDVWFCKRLDGETSGESGCQWNED
jgi:hypothetical protein